MRRVIAIAVAGAGLAGCSSFSMDSFKLAAPEVPVQLESVPPGADAKTSLGPGCRTPCTVQVPAPDAGFSVTFTMDRYLPATIPVQVIRNTGDFNSSPPVVMDPSPVVAELQPAPGAPPKAVKHMRPKKPKPQKSAAAPAAAAPATTGSAFPAPVPGAARQ
ncbi:MULTISPECIES: hypothetical protein [unclassified Bradyrhizobium]|uniref:hypothetical protein n=1 Tax=unclassified Bradyrhizobium TaxID=2631580 RepID=UPI0028F16A56|nr:MULTISPECIES: hypothetical protein [unclassified Bradyrhizobium]